ncbi:type I polyketide synthase [Deinococcus kurensis]|uniref:type I polyketide synthase n=1 Tax=Deinococcus kurensis TaxID=2662757 RepID=UPI0012D2CFE5|nr:type I polyketide synthase [Deinococcus kurensis]
MDVPATDIAIVGMACRYPGAPSLDAFWTLLREGRSGLVRYSDEALLAAGVPADLLAQPGYVRVGAPLEDMEGFDGAFFGFSPREAAILDPQHRHFLEVCWEALEAAGQDPAGFEGRIGVFGGSGQNAYFWRNLLTHPELLADEGLFLLRHTGNDKDFLSTRVSYLLDLRGPSVNVQTACSTSLVAVHLAAQSLLAGDCDLALAGGVTIELPHRHGYLFKEGEVQSPDGACRAFDAQAGGTVFGSGVGVVALRRLDEALRDGDHVHAVIKGSAVNNDGGRKVGYLAPSVDGQVEAAREALSLSGCAPDSIGLIEAHGTGTPIGDPIEVASLAEVYPAGDACALGSVKTNIGHTDVAAGVAGLIKAALAVEHGVIPASLNFRTPNPALELDRTRFYVPARTQAWPGSGPRRAAVNSLGVGGTNAHVILEQAPPRPRRAPDAARPELLLLSARTEAALDEASRRLAAHLERPGGPELGDPDLGDVAVTLRRRHPFARRRTVAARSAAEAAARLRARIGRGAAPAPAAAPALVFLFPGAGVQHPSMGAGLYRQDGTYRRAIDRCAEVLEGLGTDLRTLLLGAEPLHRPSQAFPALLATQYALACMWQAWGLRPAAVLGHSLGEYAAACVAGVFQLDDALRVVVERGRLFERAEPGAMTSVLLPEAQVRARLWGRLSVSVVNAPDLTVVGGPLADIDTFERQLQAGGVEFRRLPLGGAGHSAVLDPVLPDFERLMRGVSLRAPDLPVASNLTGGWLGPEAADPLYWVRHLREPVRFSDGLTTLASLGRVTLLELGPGGHLGRTARRHPALGGAAAVAAMRGERDDLDDLDTAHAALGALWEAGHDLDWSRLSAQQGARVSPLPTYPFEHQRRWFEPLAPAPALAEPTPDAGPEEVFLGTPAWRRSLPLPRGERLDGQCVWALVEETALGAAVLDELTRRGARVWPLRRPASAPLAWLDAQLAARPAGLEAPTSVLYAWTLGGADDPVTGSDEVDDELTAAFHVPMTLLRHLEGAAAHWLLAASGSVQVAGERLSAPVRAALIGPARVAATELGVRARVVDLDRPLGADRRPARLCDELCALGRDDAAQPLVAWRGDTRLTAALDPLPLPEAPPPWPMPGTYLITGGFGDLGLAAAAHLARLGPVRLALLGRHAVPPRGDWAQTLSRAPHSREAAHIRAVQALERLGASVLPLGVDVADEGAVQRAVELIQTRWGPLHGVLHAAGSLRDQLIVRGSPEVDAEVLRPKVQGTLALLRVLRRTLTQPEALRSVTLYSSVSALTGLPGQAAYSAANAVLDAAGLWGRGQGLPVTSVAWGAWQQIGLAQRVNRDQGWTPLDTAGAGPAVFEAWQQRGPDTVFRTQVSPEADWMLGEHRTALGSAVMPGTGFLAWAQAALERCRPPGCQGALQLEQVTFLSPLVVGEEGRELRVSVRREDLSGSRLSWSVWTTGSGEHAQGHAAFVPVPSPVPAPAAPELRPCPLRPHPVMRFGPRWACVTGQRAGPACATLHLDLPPEYRLDLLTWPLHPALLDMATGGAQALMPDVSGDDLFVPFSYGQLLILGPLDGPLVSHVTLTGRSDQQATLDVVVRGADGRERLRVTDFVMRRAPVTALDQAPVSDPPDQADVLDLRGALTPAQGLRALDQVVATGAAQVIVSAWPPERWASPAPTPEPAPQGAEAPPGEALEGLIRGVWQALLGVDAIGPEDHFMDLGGHSLLLTRAVSRVRDLTGRRLPLGPAFDTPTVAAWAALLAQTQTPAPTPEPLEQTPRSLPLPPSMHRFLTERAGGPLTHWNIAQLLDLRAPLTAAQVEGAAWALLRRHDALRTQLRPAPDGWHYQLLEPQDTHPFTHVSLADVPDADLAAQVTAACTRAQQSFDLERGGLLRVVFLDLGPRRGARALLVAHHLAADALSWSVLLHDFQQALRQLLAGQEATLPARGTSFEGWVRGLERVARAPGLAETLREPLALPWQEAAPLPTDWPATPDAGANHAARSVEVTLDAPVTLALRARASAEHLPMQDVVGAALAAALGEWTGRPCVLIDSMGQGREEDLLNADLTPTVGFFTAYLPLLVQGAGQRDLHSLARDVQRQRESRAHLLLQVARAMTDDAALARHLSEVPRAQVLLNYIGQRQELGVAGLDAALLAPAPEDAGPTHAPDGLRGHPLALKASVGADGLHLTFVYSGALHRRETILTLAQRCLALLAQAALPPTPPGAARGAGVQPGRGGS